MQAILDSSFACPGSVPIWGGGGTGGGGGKKGELRDWTMFRCFVFSRLWLSPPWPRRYWAPLEN